MKRRTTWGGRTSRAAVGVVVGFSSIILGAATGASPRVVTPWQTVAIPSHVYPGAMLLLTNGSVLVQDQGSSNSGSSGWWLLSPTTRGSYVGGTWKQAASLPTGYGPVSFASAVLPDGRVVIAGGEDNLGNTSAFTNKSAIYDPVANTWTAIAPPSGAQWNTIGDAPGTVLANGTFMVGGSGNYTNKTQALLNAKTLTWSITGTGKVDANEEAGFSLLPDGHVMAIGIQGTPNYVENYNPVTGAWSNGGTIPVAVVDAIGGEIGPQVLRPDGTVLVLGATGHTAVYNTHTHTWTAGPDFPVVGGAQPHSSDGPAAVLPNGQVLIDASPGLYSTPSHFFLFNGTTLSPTVDAPFSATLESNWGYMLVLPTGQVLFNDRFGHMEVYTGSGAALAQWRPVITKVTKSLLPGHTYVLSGTQLNGLTQGSSYGDDYQSATNYPLVRLTYATGGRVVYARTFAMSSMSVTPSLASHAQFVVPLGLPAGKATLVVVANGVASVPVNVTL